MHRVFGVFGVLGLTAATSLVGVCLLASGCSSGGGQGAPGGSGGQKDAGGGGQTGSGGSGGGQSGSGGGSGGAVITGSGGAGGGVDAGPGGSGGGMITPDSGAPDGATPADTGTRRDCPAGAVICEDFEKYASGATDLAPDWLTYKYGGGPCRSTPPRPFRDQVAAPDRPVGGRKYADIVKQNPLDKELLPVKHYGRVMVWVTALPSTVHWNINQAGGPLASNAQLIGKYSFGGQNCACCRPTIRSERPSAMG